MAARSLARATIRRGGTAVAALAAAGLLAAPLPAPAQPARFEDVVRHLRHPDPKARIASIRMLREAGHPEAIEPIAALVADPVAEVRLEAIAAELSLFLAEPIQARRRIALVVEVRTDSPAAAAFAAGPLAGMPRPVPPVLVSGLAGAVQDESGRVRREAAYALGVIARPPIDQASAAALIDALDHFDPPVRTAVARVIGRLQIREAGDALIRAMDDSQEQVRLAAMRALGEIEEARAVRALFDQFTHFSTHAPRNLAVEAALYGLTRIGHASSVPLFRSLLGDERPVIRRLAAEGLGRAGDLQSVVAIERAMAAEPSSAVRAAMAYALQRNGQPMLDRLVENLGEPALVHQVQQYLVELGPAIAARLVPHLQHGTPAVRAAVADVLGAVGGASVVAGLERLRHDHDTAVAGAATRAIERLQLRLGDRDRSE